MPTNAEILDLAQGAGYLAVNAVRKGGIFNNSSRLNPILPQQIYALYFIINKIYTLNPTYAGMDAACNYLWEIMGRYGVQAQSLVGSGGSVAPPSSTQGFPIYITEANFETATFYPNTNLFGNNIRPFLNQINRYLLDGEYTVSSTGFTVLLDGFDASQYEYEIVIEKVYT